MPWDVEGMLMWTKMQGSHPSKVTANEWQVMANVGSRFQFLVMNLWMFVYFFGLLSHQECGGQTLCHDLWTWWWWTKGAGALGKLRAINRKEKTERGKQTHPNNIKTIEDVFKGLFLLRALDLREFDHTSGTIELIPFSCSPCFACIRKEAWRMLNFHDIGPGPRSVKIQKIRDDIGRLSHLSQLDLKKVSFQFNANPSHPIPHAVTQIPGPSTGVFIPSEGRKFYLSLKDSGRQFCWWPRLTFHIGA